MSELVFLKLGGSLITDKARPYTARQDKLEQLAQEIRAARQRQPALRLVLGHGSGSFGHYAVTQHLQGRARSDPERGAAEVWYRASQLNRLVMDALHGAGLPAIAFPPSASVSASEGTIASWDLQPLRAALQARLMPVIYGDIVFDVRTGTAILSTEDLLCYLARHLQPQRILLAGLEPGVWADFPARRRRVEKVDRAVYASLAETLRGSQATDVTGGMKSKVEKMLALASEIPALAIWIFSGEERGNVDRALRGEPLGTRITG